MSLAAGLALTAVYADILKWHRLVAPPFEEGRLVDSCPRVRGDA
jgi:hypothetical protein